MTNLILASFIFSEVLAVTTPVEIGGVAPTCVGPQGGGEDPIGNDIDLSNCSCEKWHLLWSADKAGKDQCH